MNRWQAMPGAEAPGAGRWYAANTRPHAEATALVNLRRQSFRCFCPTQLRTVRHARQFRTSRTPLFPGYLFVQLDLAFDRWRSINGTRGVVSLVTGGGDPLPLPHGAVEALLGLASGDGVVSFGPALKAGQQVKMLAGPFAEQLGTLEHLDGQGRVRVLLEMMGAYVRIDSHVRHLAPA